MAEHVVEASESPRELFSTAHKIWGWAPLYGLTLALLVAATVLACVSIFTLHATPEIILSAQNNALDLQSFLATYEHLFTADEYQLARNQPCQLLLNKGCDMLFPSPAAASDMANVLTSSITSALTGEGTLDAAMLAQAGPYTATSCAWLPGITPGTVITGTDRFPTRVLGLTLSATTLPEMVSWQMEVGCHTDLAQSWTIRQEDQVSEGARTYKTHLATYATVHYRYRAGTDVVQLVRPDTPSQTRSDITGEASQPVAYYALSRYVGFHIVAAVPFLVATGMFTFFFGKAARRYQRGRRELAALQSLVEGQQERVVGHIRAPLGAQVPRARVRGVYEADVSPSNGKTEDQIAEDGTTWCARRGSQGEEEEEVEFPYGRGTYQTAESGQSGVLDGGEGQAGAAHAREDLSDAPHYGDQGVADQASQQTARTTSSSRAPEAISSSTSVVVVVAEAEAEAPHSVGVPLASSSPTAGGGRLGRARTTASPFTENVGASLVREHSQYQLSMRTMLHSIIVEILVAAMLMLLVCVFHLCGTLEHWRYLDGTGTAAAARLTPHPRASAACMNFASLGLICSAAAAVWLIYSRENF